MIIKVNIWDKLVGSLLWNSKRNTSSFEYDRSFVTSSLEVSPFLMPLKENAIYQFSHLNYDTYLGLPPMIADSLPDDFGNQIMNTWLAMQGKIVNDILPLERLGYMGKRGMGALEYEPILDTPKELRGDIKLDELVSIANQVMNSKLDMRYEDIDKNSISNILRIGTSAGGARPKAILAYDEVNKVFKAGDVLHSSGHSYWVMKIDGVADKSLGDPEGYGKIEYAYYKMAVDAGIKMAECQLKNENGRSHFMSKRFDRIDQGDKLHMQSLNGLAAMDYKAADMYSYEQVFTVLRRMMLPYDALEQQFRRMVFNIVGRNQDDHTKNISFLMDKTGKWALSPGYDISYNYNPNGVWTRKHQLSVNGKRDLFTTEDLLKVGRENNIKNPKLIIEYIIEVVSKWKEYAKELDIEKAQYEAISKQHRLSFRNNSNKVVQDILTDIDSKIRKRNLKP